MSNLLKKYRTMKKIYIKPVMTEECTEMDCILNLQSGGTTSQGGITVAGGRDFSFEDDDEAHGSSFNWSSRVWE